MHKKNCQCPFCKNKRGELKGKNCYNFGKRGKKAGRYKHGNYCKEKIHYCIVSNCNKIVCGPNRRCCSHAMIERFKDPKEKEKLKGKIPWNKLSRETRTCICGCGEIFECKITSKKRFIYGHQARNENNSMFGKNHTKRTKRKISESHKGVSLSKEHKKKIGKSLENRIFSEEHKKKIGLKHKNKFVSQETKRKISLSHGGTGIKGELSKYGPEFTKQLKEQIRERDNYTCQICGITEEKNIIIFGKVLSIHHIDYNKMNNDKSNLISLCHSCHTKTNTNREYWQEYYKKKVLINV